MRLVFFDRLGGLGVVAICVAFACSGEKAEDAPPGDGNTLPTTSEPGGSMTSAQPFTSTATGGAGPSAGGAGGEGGAGEGEGRGFGSAA